MAAANWRWPIPGPQYLAGTAGRLTFVGGVGFLIQSRPLPDTLFSRSVNDLAPPDGGVMDGRDSTQASLYASTLRG